MAEKKVLTRDDILGAAQRPMEAVDLPELGGIVYVQGLTGAERDRYEASVMHRRRDGQMVPNLQGARARLIAVTLVDADCRPLFREDEEDVIAALPARTLQRIWDKATELSGLAEEDVENLAGNSAAVRVDGSSSDSPATSGSPSRTSRNASAAESSPSGAPSSK